MQFLLLPGSTISPPTSSSSQTCSASILNESSVSKVEVSPEKSYDLVSSVHITGYQNSNKVLKWLNIADLILVGSHKEGWSISMLESLACGKGIVSTDVSGAQELISEGKNGYVVQSRNPLEYAIGIKKGLELNNTFDISLEIVSKYTLSSLKNDLGKLWLR